MGSDINIRTDLVIWYKCPLPSLGNTNFAIHVRYHNFACTWPRLGGVVLLISWRCPNQINLSALLVERWQHSNLTGAFIPWAQCLPQQEVWSPLAQESRLTLLTLFRARWVGNHTVHNHHNVDRFSSPWILEWRVSAIVHHLRHYTKRASSTIIHKCFSMLQFGSRQPAASNY